ncbi:MAG: cyclase family protein [Candidatus Doudnabacteria bacterium]|nr:cyclase family protein [Candidatus Doudnabacteria bacterium]
MYIDLTRPFNGTMPVYPGDPLPSLLKIANCDVDGFEDHELKSAMHVGTHMDAPAHMIAGGKKISEYGPEKFIGQAVLLNAAGLSEISEEILSKADISQSDMVIIKTGWEDKFFEPEYFADYPGLTENFAKKLLGLGVSILGLDTPSPDRSPYAVHKILLSGEVLIIENLTNLKRLPENKKFELIALPLKLESNASFCRVVAKI